MMSSPANPAFCPHRGLVPALSSLVLLVAACQGPASVDAPAANDAPTLAGSWRAVLASRGGELPFELRIREAADGLVGHAVTGPEEVALSDVEQNGRNVVLRFSWYDSEITARFDESGDRLEGRWRKTVPEGDSVLPFTATRGFESRFLTLDELAIEAASDVARAALSSVAGDWRVEFRDEEGHEPARGEFEQEGETVSGTFLTPTGDYRFLEGSYQGGVLRLSTFDGAHAFLFVARAQDDGTLVGDFHSRDTYHATWSAERVADDVAVLPDGWNEVGLTNRDGRFAFTFPDLQGAPVSLTDERFAGKVVLVNVFGSWCPNCNDEAPLLARFDREYRDRGLEVVGLAYEFSGDAERDRGMVSRFAARHGIEYPLLLAGTSDKRHAAATLPDLTAVLSYPTNIFLGRDGRVRAIHSGFAGPGTGEHHQLLVAELEAKIEELLVEPAS